MLGQRIVKYKKKIFIEYFADCISLTGRKINTSNKSQKSYRVSNLKDFFHKQPWELRPNDFSLIFFATNYRGDRSFPETIPGACVINALNWKSGYRVEELIKKPPKSMLTCIYFMNRICWQYWLDCRACTQELKE